MLFPSCHVKTRLRFLERVQGAFDIDIRVAAGEALFGAGLGFPGALYVDFVGTFGSLGQDGDFVGENFGESPRYGQALFSGVGVKRDFSDGEFGDQRGVAGQDAQVAVLAGNLCFSRPWFRPLSFPASRFRVGKCQAFRSKSFAPQIASAHSPTANGTTTVFMRPLSSSPRLPELPRWGLSCRKPARGCRRICLRQLL